MAVGKPQLPMDWVPLCLAFEIKRNGQSENEACNPERGGARTPKRKVESSITTTSIAESATTASFCTPLITASNATTFALAPRG